MSSIKAANLDSVDTKQGIFFARGIGYRHAHATIVRFCIKFLSKVCYVFKGLLRVQENSSC